MASVVDKLPFARRIRRSGGRWGSRRNRSSRPTARGSRCVARRPEMVPRNLLSLPPSPQKHLLPMPSQKLRQRPKLIRQPHHLAFVRLKRFGEDSIGQRLLQLALFSTHHFLQSTLSPSARPITREYRPPKKPLSQPHPHRPSCLSLTHETGFRDLRHIGGETDAAF